MLAALQQTTPPKRFFLDTFFPNVVKHETETVELDIFKGKRRIAAYVNPIHDGVVVEREGYSTSITRPAYTKEMTVLRVTDTRTRSIGKDIYNTPTPEERAAQLLGEDLAMLEERLTRRLEKMCAEAITTGKVIVKGKGWDAQVDFGYVNGTNIKILSGTSCWDKATADPMKDLDSWRLEISKRCGIAPNYCIIGSRVGWAIIDNPKIKERLNILNYQMGKVTPESLPEGISYFGDLMLPSGKVSLYSYDEAYTDPDTGADVPLVPEDMVILGSSNARCQMNYGLIQNLNSLKAETRFPLVWQKPDGSARFVQLESAPMPNLYQVDAFTVAHVLTEDGD
jgi:hypothetical protein